MQRGREEEEEELEEEEEEEEDGDGGPESALEKSPFQLTPADVYDISAVVGRDLLQLRAGPDLPAARARLQFRIVRVLEMLEALVSESSVAEEQLRRERDSLRRELELLRAEPGPGSAPQLSLGPGKMVIDLSDPNRPRFTLQELQDVLQERNQLKAQLLVVQEELQCYKRVKRGAGTCLAGSWESPLCSQPSGCAEVGSSHRERTKVKNWKKTPVGAVLAAARTVRRRQSSDGCFPLNMENEHPQGLLLGQALMTLRRAGGDKD
ncbi:RILP-like protein 2 isoform X1 [Pithys albifrons albifrons]|uniref:RILP-like protein 2 isoform X1 n=1 Tax=Pithys albifrons albifrons TaxID=3385563 RepID=UPI003A5CD95D